MRLIKEKPLRSTQGVVVFGSVEPVVFDEDSAEFAVPHNGVDIACSDLVHRTARVAVDGDYGVGAQAVGLVDVDSRDVLTRSSPVVKCR